MFIRYYDKCIICEKKFYIGEKGNGIKCNPGKVCEECKPYYIRANSEKNRLGTEIDYKYIKKLLMQNKCTYCGRTLTWEEKEIEHKIPVCKGGTNKNDNLCLSCEACNGEKGNMSYYEYLRFRKTHPFNASNKKALLDLITKHELITTEVDYKIGVEQRKIKNPVIKNKVIRDSNNRIIGIRKVIVDTEDIEIKTKITETHLTEWGEVYNAACKLFGKEPIEESISYETVK